LSEKIIIHPKPEIIDLVQPYINNRKKDIVVMKELLKQDKIDEIKVLGHKMKGGGKLYGMEPVTALGDRIEKAAIAVDKAEIGEALGILEDYLARVNVEGT
jgi:Hpt domain